MRVVSRTAVSRRPATVSTRPTRSRSRRLDASAACAYEACRCIQYVGYVGWEARQHAIITTDVSPELFIVITDDDADADPHLGDTV